ncbi:hypothetical protein BV379_05580 [Rhodovulum sulfidophilum]|nr:hypothetical protein BV379_05580 [Rhodovulum sulfidophilum]
MTWDAAPTGRRGRQRIYSDAAIQSCLTMKVLFGMALRQTTGFVESLLRLVGLDWSVPDFSTLSRRQQTLAVNIGICATGPFQSRRGNEGRSPLHDHFPRPDPCRRCTSHTRRAEQAGVLRSEVQEHLGRSRIQGYQRSLPDSGRVQVRTSVPYVGQLPSKGNRNTRTVRAAASTRARFKGVAEA